MDVALNVSDEFRAFTETHPITVGNRGTLTGRVGEERRTIQIPDVLADPDYGYWEAQRIGHFRTLLGVPLLRGDLLLGVLNLWRTQPEPFDAADVELVTLFADQAAIAIEQARRTHELSDALEQQTASSAVLRIISASTGELTPVFEELIKSAVKLCRADHGGIVRYDAKTNQYIETADYGIGNEEYRRAVRRPYEPSRGTLVGRTIIERAPVRIDDVLADPEYRFLEAQRAGGYRSIVGVPMLRENFPIGVIAVWRLALRPFTDREIRILTTFADQAVVAVENARLMLALQRQTEELSRYVTPQVASLLASEEGEQLLTGHRRLITAMFCDLRGFSTFSETAEPEEVFSVLREYQAEMGKLLAAHGGTLEHLAGDGIMAFFNDPIQTPGFEAQTVDCAVAMRDRFATLASGWRRRGYELNLGIGIALGYATVGRVGYEGHYQYNAIGNAVILASRLSAEARGGEILITQRLYAAVEGRITVDPAREVTVKGFTRPIPVYNVVALTAGDVG
jgi:class 3 adenylate cyclase/putative methionine-R-sulfoxide reductase with GAF domain